MGSLLRVLGEGGADIGVVPSALALALRSRAFRRSLAKDEISQFLRSTDDAESRELEPIGSSRMLLALGRLDAFVRDERARRHDRKEPVELDDLLFLRTSKHARIHEARVRTGFPSQGSDWDDAIVGPLTGSDPWRDVPEGESRAWVRSILGPIAPRADGAYEVRGHTLREATGPRSRRFESREQTVTIYFVAPEEHPDWRSLLAALESRGEAPVRIVAR